MRRELAPALYIREFGVQSGVTPSLENLLAVAKTLPPDDLPAFLGALETVRVTALARLASPPVAKPDELLTVEQTAERLNVSQNYLYRQSRRLPFTRRIGRKLLFSSSGLDLYLKKSK
jgi:excisionase family DNA binding protein